MKKLIVIAMVLGLVSIASAETWVPATGNWNAAGNWTNPSQVPTATSPVTINVVGADVTIGATAVAKQVSLGAAIASGTATLNVSSGFTLKDTSSASTDKAWLSVGQTASTSGVLNVSTSGADIKTSRLRVAWGTSSAGSFTMNDGLVTVGLDLWTGNTDPQFFIGNGQNSVGHVYLNGGTLDLSHVTIGTPGTGTNWSTDSYFRMAMNSTMSTATLDISGGAIILPGNILDLRNAIKTAYESGVTLTGYGIADNFAYSYNAQSGTTTVTGIVPEPATVALLGLGGLALIRRKRS